MSTKASIENWINERCNCAPGRIAETRELWLRWSEYAEAVGERPAGIAAFSRALAGLGFKRDKTNRFGQRFHGIAPKPEPAAGWPTLMHEAESPASGGKAAPPVPIIPAAPGIYLLSVEYKADGCDFERALVVGWRVEGEVARPIVAAMPGENAAILLPDGSILGDDRRAVRRVVEAGFANEKDWRAHHCRVASILARTAADKVKAAEALDHEEDEGITF